MLNAAQYAALKGKDQSKLTEKQLAAIAEYEATLAQAQSEQSSDDDIMAGIDLDDTSAQQPPVKRTGKIDFNAFIKTNLEKGKKASRSETRSCIVTSVSNWKDAKGDLPTLMVETSVGTYWPLAKSVYGLPDFIDPSKGVKAFITLTESKSGEFVNCSSLKFESPLDPQVYAAIRALPKGTSLTINL